MRPVPYHLSVRGETVGGTKREHPPTESLACNFACSCGQEALASAAPLYSFRHDYVHRFFRSWNNIFWSNAESYTRNHARARILRKTISHPFICGSWSWAFRTTNLWQTQVEIHTCTFCCEASAAETLNKNGFAVENWCVWCKKSIYVCFAYWEVYLREACEKLFLLPSLNHPKFFSIYSGANKYQKIAHLLQKPHT